MNRCWATFSFVLLFVVFDRDEVHPHKNFKNHLERQDLPIKDLIWRRQNLFLRYEAEDPGPGKMEVSFLLG